MKLEGKVVVVTGAARGIGREYARYLAGLGARVVIADINDCAQTLELVRSEKGTAICTKLDVANAASAVETARMALDAFGRIDALINNAALFGGLKGGRFDTISEAEWDAAMAVNVKGIWNCCKAVVPAMRQAGGGSIVNVASVRSVVAGGNNIQYDTAKHAVAGLTRGLAMDHGAEGIRVNAVCPGPIFTPFHARRLQAAGKTVAQYNEDAAGRTMLKRPGTAEEVAACIFFLASSEASYVTGSLLFVDGGMTAM